MSHIGQDKDFDAIQHEEKSLFLQLFNLGSCPNLRKILHVETILREWIYAIQLKISGSTLCGSKEAKLNSVNR